MKKTWRNVKFCPFCGYTKLLTNYVKAESIAIFQCVGCLTNFELSVNGDT